MNRLFLGFMICTILTSSCTKLIKNEDALIENETQSNTANVQLDRFASKGICISTISELQGLWVGSFNANSEYLTKKIVDKGKTAWHTEQKITIVIDSIQGTKINGYSIIAGITKKLIGSLQEDANTFVLQLTEAGRDFDKGIFTLTIAKSDSVLQGNWTAGNTIDIPMRNCRFTKKSFSYSPEISFVQIKDIKEDNTIKSTVSYPSEYDEWYGAVESNYDIVYKVNPSSTLLSESDVERLTKSELMLLRNTIFARHGYAFKKRPLRIYYEKQPWYVPVSSNPKAGLTTIEQQNIALIVRYENNFGQYDAEYGR